MSIVRLIEYADAAHDPALLRRTWENMREVMAVVGLANQTNRLVNGLRIPVDPQFK